MNIYLHELKANIRSACIYAAGMLLLMLLFFSFYPAFAKDATDFLKLFQSFPVEIQNALGFAFIDIISLLGYYSFAIVYVVLLGAVQSMNLGVSILSKEERDKTADFLFTKPASRLRIITSKLLSALTLIVLTNLVYFILSFVAVRFISGETFSLKIFFLINFTLFLTQLIFLSLGFLVGVFLKRIKSTISITLAVVFGFFAIGAFAVNSSDDKMRYLSPFKYFDSSHIIADGSYETSYLLVGLGLVLCFLVASYVVYLRKDIEGV